ncbi:MAG TPA: SpoVA/SpoVAEb family sporulation membrane protein [Bacillota bacterium]|nr:SpoVA/SpoVAEb family sporulation membrane protein [Bacillota bacterium]
MSFIWAFVIGGALCVAAQLVVDLTPLTPAHAMVLFVSLGAILSAFGLYEGLLKLAGAGASVPLTGFGHVLVQGIIKDVGKKGASGMLTGGLTASAMGVTAAVLLGALMAAVFTPRG